MSDRASADKIVEIQGKKYFISPLGLGDLDLAEDAALAQWKERQIKTFTESKSLEGVFTKSEIMIEVRRISQLTADDLPKKTTDIFEVDNQGEIVFKPEIDKVTGELTGRKYPVLREIEIDYAGWWISQTIQGKLMAIWLSLKTRQPDITYEIADEMFKEAGPGGGKATKDAGYDKDLLKTVADVVGEVTRPTAGTEKND